MKSCFGSRGRKEIVVEGRTHTRDSFVRDPYSITVTFRRCCFFSKSDATVHHPIDIYVTCKWSFEPPKPSIEAIARIPNSNRLAMGKSPFSTLLCTASCHQRIVPCRFKLLIFLAALLLSGNGHVSCFAVGSTSHRRMLQNGNVALGKTNKTPLFRKYRQGSSALVSSFSSDVNEDVDDQGDEETVLRGGAAQPPLQDPGIWPRFDELDKRLIKISLPVIANFAINPLIGAVDLFWVNRMGNALAVAGQAAANQVFNSAFWITSFLPSVTATLIAKEKAMGNEDGVQDSVCQALFVGVFMALASSALVFGKPNQVLGSVLAEGAPAMEYARPYLIIRAFAFVPSLISLVGFSAFRGVLDTVTPVKISLFANVFNALLDPILIFSAGMGVTGAALATLAAELISCVAYLVIMRRRHMISFRKLFKAPAWARLEPLIRGGAALQLRNVALNITFLAVARVTQGIDKSGVAAAAHALAIQGKARCGLKVLVQLKVDRNCFSRFPSSFSLPTRWYCSFGSVDRFTNGSAE